MIFKKSLNQEKAFIAGDKTILREVLHPQNDKVPINYSIAQAIIQPNQASTPHRLTGSETYYFLGGEGVIYIDEEHVDVKKGDVVFVPANALQYVRNTGEVDLDFMCIVEPYWTPESEVVL